MEDWFCLGMSTSDNRFVFIEKIIRAGVTGDFFEDVNDYTLSHMPLENSAATTPDIALFSILLALY
jgi:hypothetical protein